MNNNNLTTKAKKIVSYYENMTNLKYGIKPYLKQKDIKILHVNLTCNNNIENILYTFNFYTPNHKYNYLLEFNTTLGVDVTPVMKEGV